MYKRQLLHRAALGSFERFIGILLENYEGKLPLWLAPTQTVIAAITDDANEYATKLHENLIGKGIRSEVDVRNEQISYKVIKDIEALWIRPNSAKIGMFADFNLRINRLGIIENIEMKQTSGDNAFDRAALNAIRKYKQIKYVRNLDDQTFQVYFSNFTLRFRPE